MRLVSAAPSNHPFRSSIRSSIPTFLHIANLAVLAFSFIALRCMCAQKRIWCCLSLSVVLSSLTFLKVLREVYSYFECSRQSAFSALRGIEDRSPNKSARVFARQSAFVRDCVRVLVYTPSYEEAKRENVLHCQCRLRNSLETTPAYDARKSLPLPGPRLQVLKANCSNAERELFSRCLFKCLRCYSNVS